MNLHCLLNSFLTLSQQDNIQCYSCHLIILCYAVSGLNPSFSRTKISPHSFTYTELPFSQYLCFMLVRLGFDSVDFCWWVLVSWICRCFVIFNYVKVFVCELTCVRECACRGQRHQLSPSCIYRLLWVNLNSGEWTHCYGRVVWSEALSPSPASSFLNFDEHWKLDGSWGEYQGFFFSWFGLSVCQTCLVSKMKQKPCSWIYNKLKNYQNKSQPISQTKANKTAVPINKKKLNISDYIKNLFSVN